MLVDWYCYCIASNARRAWQGRAGPAIHIHPAPRTGLHTYLRATPTPTPTSTSTPSPYRTEQPTRAPRRLFFLSPPSRPSQPLRVAQDDKTLRSHPTLAKQGHSSVVSRAPPRNKTTQRQKQRQMQRKSHAVSRGIYPTRVCVLAAWLGLISAPRTPHGEIRLPRQAQPSHGSSGVLRGNRPAAK